jgi:hypothetical protein
MPESDVDPSHPLKIYLNMRSNSQTARQFWVLKQCFPRFRRIVDAVSIYQEWPLITCHCDFVILEALAHTAKYYNKMLEQ